MPTAFKKKMEKRQDIELLRIASAFAIVWYHAQAPGRPVAYSGLVVFLVLSMYLAGDHGMTVETVVRRAQRILIPWAVWFVVYGLFNLLVHKRPIIPMGGGIVAGVLSGPRIHLWYMPFIFGALVTFDATRAVMSRRLLAWGSTVAYCAILITTPLWRGPSLAGHTPSEQYAHAAAGLFLGVFLACNGVLTQRAKWLAFSAMTLATLTAWAHTYVAVPYLVGLAAACMLTTDWSRRFRIDVSALSSLALGIYFIHPLFLTLFEGVTPRGTYSLAILAVAASTLTVWVLRRASPGLARYWS